MLENQETTAAPETTVPPVENAPEATKVEDVKESPEKPPEGENRDEKGRFKGVQQRIDELTRARREAEREAAYWRERATVQPEVKQEPKPTPDKFGTYDDYVEALTDWKADQAAQKVKAELAKATAAAAEDRVTRSVDDGWNERIIDARKALPDFDEVLGSADIRIPAHVEQAIKLAHRGPEVAYYLAKNPQEAQKLAGLSPVQSAMEIGRLEASLSVRTQKPTSKAPEPAKPLSSGSTSVGDPSKMTMDQYIEFRNKQGARFRG